MGQAGRLATNEMRDLETGTGHGTPWGGQDNPKKTNSLLRLTIAFAFFVGAGTCFMPCRTYPKSYRDSPRPSCGAARQVFLNVSASTEIFELLNVRALAWTRMHLASTSQGTVNRERLAAFLGKQAALLRSEVAGSADLELFPPM